MIILKMIITEVESYKVQITKNHKTKIKEDTNFVSFLILRNIVHDNTMKLKDYLAFKLAFFLLSFPLYLLQWNILD